jgi:hypothetical protein
MPEMLHRASTGHSELEVYSENAPKKECHRYSDHNFVVVVEPEE